MMDYKLIFKLTIAGALLGGVIGYLSMFAYNLMTAPLPVEICAKITENQNSIILQCKDRGNG
jgi:hypothetical protein